MKTKFYFFLARILIELTYWFRVLSIKSEKYKKIFEIRAICYSNISPAKKIVMMREVNQR
jgi:hypothetical protein